ncbi:MAG: ParB N-terminal domain-containing protein [Bacteroidetes bacterium]|nr:ParB N-terminal domain-containing protein [Bacteroidota bacterium]
MSGTSGHLSKRRHKRLQIPLAQLGVSPWNVRQEGINIELDELAESFERHGQLQPIIVHKNESMFI